ncbi:MAG: histidine ammonia-lyase [Bacteroidetes bacterium]|jgi:histidine ammonia-lyase|nr:histidine ammonia-lyase [Bacteroidota bacterium]
MARLVIHPDGLPLEEVAQALKQSCRIELSDSAEKKIVASRDFLERKIYEQGEIIYGVNTGFGSLCNVSIEPDQLDNLQVNLIRSHAAGMGAEVPNELVRLMLLLKIQNFSTGNSGVRLELVRRLVDFYNADVLPVVYVQGSLGASGDLAPLAHLALPLIGEGSCYWKGERREAKEVLDALGWEPLELKAKEGLALLNGTQFSTAYAAWAVLEAENAIRKANLCAALSMEAFNVQLSPLHDRVHQIRNQRGQIDVAADLRRWLEGSDIGDRSGKTVQDPYSFRCVPQVHGASAAALTHVRDVVQAELNSVTDNPNVLPNEDEVVSAGNFHGQPVALVLDYLGIALSEISNISERRTYQLISGQRGLPAYLVDSPGLHSGLMIAQYTAASIVSKNKQLCTPASVDSIVSSLGQEDHVSMSANAAVKMREIVENVWSVLGIEFLTAAQAWSFRSDQMSEGLEDIYQKFREQVPVLTADRIQHDDMVAATAFIRYWE